MTALAVAILIFAAAMLYSSVGHAGASGYLAAMALCGVATAVMKPTALALNILVATIATARFYRAGCFSRSLLWPFAVASVPLAFIGGAVTLPDGWYKPAVGTVLLFAGYGMACGVSGARRAGQLKPAPVPAALASGAGIGFLSGLTGTGGGIFLSPLLLFMGWAETRESAGVSAAFILVNSVAGLAGNLASLRVLAATISYWLAAAGAGGLIGAEFGSRRLGGATLRRLLSVVLVIAGLKLMLVA